MLHNFCVQFLSVTLLCSFFGRNYAQECEGKQINNATLDQKNQFLMKSIDQQIAIQVSIPDGYLQNKIEEISDNLPKLKRDVSNPFAWSVSIVTNNATTENPVLVLIKDGRTEKTFKLP